MSTLAVPSAANIDKTPYSDNTVEVVATNSEGHSPMSHETSERVKRRILYVQFPHLLNENLSVIQLAAKSIGVSYLSLGYYLRFPWLTALISVWPALLEWIMPWYASLALLM